jgi:hypothetical protein
MQKRSGELIKQVAASSRAPPGRGNFQFTDLSFVLQGDAHHALLIGAAFPFSLQGVPPKNIDVF